METYILFKNRGIARLRIHFDHSLIKMNSIFIFFSFFHFNIQNSEFKIQNSKFRIQNKKRKNQRYFGQGNNNIPKSVYLHQILVT